MTTCGRFVATAAQMKELDRLAIEQEGISSLALMEQAAQAVADVVEELLTKQQRHAPIGTKTVILCARGELSDEDREQLEHLNQIANPAQDEKPRVAVLCGTGNNGGDGIAAAGILLQRGWNVRAFLVGNREKMTQDARAMAEKLTQLGGTLEPFDPENQEQVIWIVTSACRVDALFGVGLSRPIEGDGAMAVRLLQNAPEQSPVVACDIPSGIHTDTGKVMGEYAVHAEVTVTFTWGKLGHYLEEGREHTGELREVEIGIPHKLVFQQEGTVHTIEGCHLPKRKPNSHKGDYGRLFILAGSVGYTGAPVFVAEGALRTGAGLVYLGVPKEIYPVIAIKCGAAMPLPLLETDEELYDKISRCDVAVLGPGLGLAQETQRKVRFLLEQLTCPVVLDADGINAICGHIDKLDKRAAPTILTPHDGEFARLTGCALPLENRLNQAKAFAQEHHCILVLKGHCTITAAPDGRVWLNTSGNAGMAKGGSGDILSGMIAALLGQKHLCQTEKQVAELVAIAVYLHGAAGDAAAKNLGEYSMLPEDILGAIHQVMRQN